MNVSLLRHIHVLGDAQVLQCDLLNVATFFNLSLLKYCEKIACRVSNHVMRK